MVRKAFLVLLLTVSSCCHNYKVDYLLSPTLDVVLLTNEAFLEDFEDLILNKGWNAALKRRYLVPKYGQDKNLSCGKIYVLFSDVPPMSPKDKDPIGLKRILPKCLTLIQLEPKLLEDKQLLYVSLTHELGHALGLRHSTEKGSIMESEINQLSSITKQDLINIQTILRRYKHGK